MPTDSGEYSGLPNDQYFGPVQAGQEIDLILRKIWAQLAAANGVIPFPSGTGPAPSTDNELTGNTPKQTQVGAGAVTVPSGFYATVQVLADVTGASFTYGRDSAEGTITQDLPAGTWLFGIATYMQTTGSVVAYFNS